MALRIGPIQVAQELREHRSDCWDPMALDGFGDEPRWIDALSASPTTQTLDINLGSESSLNFMEPFPIPTPFGENVFFVGFDALNGQRR